MYSADIHGYCESCASLQSVIEPLLLIYRVDLALWGHHHSYQRTCALSRGKCVPTPGYETRGVVHSVIGAAGYEFSQVASGPDSPAWLRYANDTQYGYAHIDVDSESLHFEFLRADGGGVLDEFTLNLPPTPS